MDAHWDSSFNSQGYLPLTLVPLHFSFKKQPAQSRAELPPRGPQALGEQTEGNLMKFSKGKCEALHLGRKRKTNQAPSGWAVVEKWRSPWGLLGFPNLLGIPRQWGFPITLGFPTHTNLHTHPPLRLWGSPAQASQPQQRLPPALLLLHQPFPRARFCSHPSP